MKIIVMKVMMRKKMRKMMDNRVFIAKCGEYEKAAEAVGRIFEAFGGAGAILGVRKSVLVKPNLLVPRKPGDAVTTHPAVVEAVCAEFVRVGAEVSLIDSTGGPHTGVVLKMLYGRCGMKDAAANSGAKLSFDTKSRSVAFPEGKTVEKLELLAPVLDAELVVSVAKAKTHSFQAMTGCVKNLFGCVPGLGKPNLHRKFPKREVFASMLIDICERVKPGFSVLDGVWGMEGAGPSGGDPKFLGFLAGGFSPYALDLAQCHLMGLRPDTVYALQEAMARGLVPGSADELEWLGDDYAPLRASCKPAVMHRDDAVPVMTERCIGCGDCARICPMQCITIVPNFGDSPQSAKIAKVDAKKCIRCYCCHEFCPIKAIEL